MSMKPVIILWVIPTTDAKDYVWDKINNTRDVSDTATTAAM